jgi:hypothetical protein
VSFSRPAVARHPRGTHHPKTSFLTNPLLARVCAETLVIISAESILNPSEDSEQSGGFRHDWDNRWDNLLGSLQPLCFGNLNLPTYLFPRLP